MNLQDKVIVVTGASSGIGSATVRQLVAAGASVVFGARRENKLATLAKELPDSQIAYQVTDVTKHEDLLSLISLAVQRFGKVDVLFNNAGIMPLSKLAEDKRDDWQNILQTNVIDLLNGISDTLPVMHHQGYGHIIATGSMAGYNIYPGSTVYCASKFAERAIMEGLRQEELPNHIKTTYLAPGMVETELLSSVGDKKRAEEIANAWHESDHVLTAEDVASLVVYMINAPDVIAINEVQIRPRAER